MATNRTPARHSGVCALIHAETDLAVRPSTCPSSPAPPDRSTKPTCHRSAVTSQASPASVRRNFAFPRRVSSMPSRSVSGVVAGRAFLACAANAACAIGQETWWSRADWITVRPRSETPAPADSRSRQVSLARDGICGSASVKVLRGQTASWQRQRRLFHISSVRRPATGRSRGLVVTQECGRSERMPQSGQHLACSSTVTRASIGFPSLPVTTEVTATPSRPSRRVASLVKPVTFSRSLLSQRLGRGSSRPASADRRGTWPRTCPRFALTGDEDPGQAVGRQARSRAASSCHCPIGGVAGSAVRT